MRFRLIWCVIVLLLAGCQRPLKICTFNRVTSPISVKLASSEMPVHISGGLDPIRVEPPKIPLRDNSPLVAMPVGEQIQETAAKIAIVDVDGLLVNQNMTGIFSASENPVEMLREKLDTISHDSQYRAVVVRINSPGGGVTASDIMWRELDDFKRRTGLPVVACLMDVGTGGALYLALAADQIVAHPTTITGGIGVILNTFNLEEALGQLNIVGVPVKAGSLVDLGSPIRAMEPEQRKILQQIADDFHSRFKDKVRRARPNVVEQDLFDGRIVSASQAKVANLIDSIGYLEDAIDMARQMARLDRANTVILHRPRDHALTPYSVTPNQPLSTSALLDIPGIRRSQLPTFLYLWQPDPSLSIVPAL